MPCPLIAGGVRWAAPLSVRLGLRLCPTVKLRAAPASPRARPASSQRPFARTSTGTTDGTCSQSVASMWPTVRGGAASCQSTCLVPSFSPTSDTSAATSLGSRSSPAASRRAHGPRCCCTTHSRAAVLRSRSVGPCSWRTCCVHGSSSFTRGTTSLRGSWFAPLGSGRCCRRALRHPATAALPPLPFAARPMARSPMRARDLPRVPR